jgi:hypothetical protein
MTKVADERLGAFARFQQDIFTRVVKGSLNPDDVENAIRPLIGLKVKSVIRKLKDLILVLAGIQIPDIAEFIVREYFKMGMNGITKIWMSDRFQEVILANAPQKTSLISQAIDKFKLSKSMWDSAMLNELGQPKPYSIGEFLALAKHLTSGQPTGKEGTLLNNGYANIFYVEAADGRMVAVYVFWNGEKWRFFCYELGEDIQWNDGRCVFSPAIA